MPLVKGYQAAGQVKRASCIEFCLSAQSAVHSYVASRVRPWVSVRGQTRPVDCRHVNG